MNQKNKKYLVLFFIFIILLFLLILLSYFFETKTNIKNTYEIQPKVLNSAILKLIPQPNQNYEIPEQHVCNLTIDEGNAIIRKYLFLFEKEEEMRHINVFFEYDNLTILTSKKVFSFIFDVYLNFELKFYPSIKNGKIEPKPKSFKVGKIKFPASILNYTAQNFLKKNINKIPPIVESISELKLENDLITIKLNSKKFIDLIQSSIPNPNSNNN